MIEKQRNELCSGNPVSAKSLGFGKGNQSRGKGSTRTPSQAMQQVEEQPNPIERHGEKR